MFLTDAPEAPATQDRARGVATVVRWAIVLGIVAAWGKADGASALALGLALCATLPGRLAPPRVDAAYSLAICVSMLGTAAGIFDTRHWQDDVMHAVCSGLLGAVALAVVPGRGRGRAALAFIATFACGCLWELAEATSDHVLDTNFSLGWPDTRGDLRADAIGALVGTVVAVRWRRR